MIPPSEGIMSQAELDSEEIERANTSGRRPVVFVHGLWLLAGSWDRWRELFESEGYSTLAPGWPDDPDNVAEARKRPEAMARQNIKQVADYFTGIVDRLKVKPVVIGHSFGGMLAQLLAGRGRAAVTVAVDPAPFRGVLPLPFSSLKVASVVLKNPANYRRAVPLTYEQFRFGFANAVDENEARELYEQFSVATPGPPLFQAAAANLNPWTPVRVDTKNPERGPMLVMSGEKDHTVPHAVASAAYRLQKRNVSPTEFREMPNRGHSLTIDSGWREIADVALEFVSRFVRPVDETRAARPDAATSRVPPRPSS
jgi:pimeloyl-ACP methyl ester carboxylesterase